MFHKTWLDGRITLYNTDCLDFMQSYQDEVNMVLTDPPYLYLDHKLDRSFNEELCFNLLYKIMAKNSILAFFGRGDSFYKWNYLTKQIGFDFKEEIIWDKSRLSTPTTALARIHETISIKQKGHIVLNNVLIDYYQYNELAEKTHRDDLRILIDAIKSCKTFQDLENLKNNTAPAIKSKLSKDSICPKLINKPNRFCNYFKRLDKGRKLSSICRVEKEHYQFIHPTQKPIDLLKHLLNLCSQPNDLVFDGFSGSASCAVACIKTNRRFIGCELDKEYFDLACKRIDEEVRQGDLF